MWDLCRHNNQTPLQTRGLYHVGGRAAGQFTKGQVLWKGPVGAVLCVSRSFRSDFAISKRVTSHRLRPNAGDKSCVKGMARSRSRVIVERQVNKWGGGQWLWIALGEQCSIVNAMVWKEWVRCDVRSARAVMIALFQA